MGLRAAYRGAAEHTVIAEFARLLRDVGNGVCRASGDGLFGAAPGQSAVFYDNDGVILCGGIIKRRNKEEHNGDQR